MRNFYTYFHTRNDTGAVFYVGKGTGRRAHSSNRSQHWKRISAKHGHTVHIASKWPTEDEAFEHEKFLIACFKDMGIPLVNKTTGGEGVAGFTPSQETRAKLSAALKGKPSKKRGRPMSEDQKEKIKNSLEGRPAKNKDKPMSDAQKEKISNSLKGRPLSDERREKISIAKKNQSKETRNKISASMKALHARKRSQA